MTKMITIESRKEFECDQGHKLVCKRSNVGLTLSFQNGLQEEVNRKFTRET